MCGTKLKFYDVPRFCRWIKYAYISELHKRKVFAFIIVIWYRPAGFSYCFDIIHYSIMCLYLYAGMNCNCNTVCLIHWDSPSWENNELSSAKATAMPDRRKEILKLKVTTMIKFNFMDRLKYVIKFRFEI